MPGRQLVVVLPLVAVAVAWLVQQFPVLRVPAAIAAVVGALTWVWLTVEALSHRLTYVVTFTTSTATPYRLLRAITPDGMRAATRDDLLLLAWTVGLALLVVAGWFAATPARETPLWRKTTQNRAPDATEADRARWRGDRARWRGLAERWRERAGGGTGRSRTIRSCAPCTAPAITIARIRADGR
jgi:hypothetical protein